MVKYLVVSMELQKEHWWVELLVVYSDDMLVNRLAVQKVVLLVVC